MIRVTSDQTATEEQHAAFAQVGSTYYPIFVAVFTALVIISNVTATKGVAFGPSSATGRSSPTAASSFSR